MDATIVTTKTGKQYNFTRIKHDVNGNPRYIVSYLALGLKSYEATDTTRRAGLRKTKSKLFGGGFTFQSYNLRQTAEFFESMGL